MSRCTEAHRCRPVASLITEPPRALWLGEITWMPPECAAETHCLHFVTPEKVVVLLVNLGDALNFAVIAQIMNGGPINPRWLEERVRYVTSQERIGQLVQGWESGVVQ